MRPTTPMPGRRTSVCIPTTTTRAVAPSSSASSWRGCARSLHSMSAADSGAGLAEVADEVTSLELFFDLVFVFVITQLTSVIVGEPTWAGIARAVLMLSVVWWMYAGYAWLTNAVPPTTGGRRILVLLAMGGFFVVALAIPDAFGDTGVVLGVAYLC